MPDAYPIQHFDAEWRRLLTPGRYWIVWAYGAKTPGSCALLREEHEVRLACAGRAQPLFDPS